jgi:S-adenosyl-L-methionine hydrolase (adenosine-forming)
MPVVTLLTDFGTADGYVAEMKGVIMSRAPEAVVVDVTHDIPPQDVEGGRLAVARYWRRFPPGTIHVAVVDPGVGSARGALAVESEERFLVGPDNGVLSPALLVAGARAVTLPIPSGAAPTFHGRDVFAPAAADLALGTPLDALGSPTLDLVIRRTPEPRRRSDGAIEGQVITIDRFGNAITNLLALRAQSVEVNGSVLPLRRSYSDAEEAQPIALVGSTGLIEIAIRDGDAAATMGLERGTPVVLRTAGRG